MIHPRNGLRHDAVNMHKADEQNSMQFFFLLAGPCNKKNTHKSILAAKI